MASFASGEISVLVATTVIEVGVDVPNASLIVIEGAERFGLAQLHQLRGRVGRGATLSRCILLRGSNLSETGRARLALMRETNDGFRIAEEDLKLRGPGEILGTRQSGEQSFRLATPDDVTVLAPLAQSDAQLLLDRDGGLDSHARSGGKDMPLSVRTGCGGRIVAKRLGRLQQAVLFLAKAEFHRLGSNGDLQLWIGYRLAVHLDGTFGNLAFALPLDAVRPSAVSAARMPIILRLGQSAGFPRRRLARTSVERSLLRRARPPRRGASPSQHWPEQFSPR